MNSELIAAIVSLISNLSGLAIKAITARTEEHDQIVADVQAAMAQFNTDLPEMAAAFHKNDTEVDAAVMAAALGEKI